MHASTVAKMEVEPILVSVPQACQMIGIGTQGMYDLIGAGLVLAVKRGTRTLIVVESLRTYAASLPPAQVAAPRKREPSRAAHDPGKSGTTQTGGANEREISQ
jgi:hypothetical protein